MYVKNHFHHVNNANVETDAFKITFKSAKSVSKLTLKVVPVSTTKHKCSSPLNIQEIFITDIKLSCGT